MKKMTVEQVRKITVPNQKTIICHCKEPEKGETYGVITHKAAQIAAQLLRKSAPALTLFMAYSLNQDGYATSSGVHHFKAYGMDKGSYHRAIGVLSENGYLTQDAGAKDILHFWSIPKDLEAAEIAPEEDYISPVEEIAGGVVDGTGGIAGDTGSIADGTGCIVDGTENNTRNNTRNNIINNSIGEEMEEEVIINNSETEQSIYYPEKEEFIISPDAEQKARIDKWKLHYAEMLNGTLPEVEEERKIVVAILERFKADHRPIARQINKYGAWVNGWDADNGCPVILLSFGYLPDDIICSRRHNIDGIPEEYYISFLPTDDTVEELTPGELHKEETRFALNDDIGSIRAEVTDMYHTISKQAADEVQAHMREYRKTCKDELDYWLEWHWRVSEEYARYYSGDDELPF